MVGVSVFFKSELSVLYIASGVPLRECKKNIRFQPGTVYLISWASDSGLGIVYIIVISFARSLTLILVRFIRSLPFPLPRLPNLAPPLLLITTLVANLFPPPCRRRILPLLPRPFAQEPPPQVPRLGRLGRCRRSSGSVAYAGVERAGTEAVLVVGEVLSGGGGRGRGLGGQG